MQAEQSGNRPPPTKNPKKPKPHSHANPPLSSSCSFLSNACLLSALWGRISTSFHPRIQKITFKQKASNPFRTTEYLIGSIHPCAGVCCSLSKLFQLQVHPGQVASSMETNLAKNKIQPRLHQSTFKQLRLSARLALCLQPAAKAVGFSVEPVDSSDVCCWCCFQRLPLLRVPSPPPLLLLRECWLGGGAPSEHNDQPGQVGHADPS